MLWLNNNRFPVGMFPNHETYLQVETIRAYLNSTGENVIKMRFEDNNDLINLMLLKRHLDDCGVHNTSLFTPFFPYSTMDHSDGSRPLSLKYVAEFINHLGFQAVYTAEPHSTVLDALVDRIRILNYKDVLLGRIRQEFSHNSFVFCFPDLGADKRYKNLFEGKYPTLTFQKDRDFGSGKIRGMRCADVIPTPQEDAVYVILDDLCRKGGTFIGCADVLRQAGAQKIVLCVTHTEMGAYAGILREDSPVDMVYTTDSCLHDDRPDYSKLNVFEVFSDSHWESRLA